MRKRVGPGEMCGRVGMDFFIIIIFFRALGAWEGKLMVTCLGLGRRWRGKGKVQVCSREGEC